MADFYKGSLMRVKIGTNTIFHETDCTVDLKRDMKSIGSKDVDGDLVTPGKKSFTISGSAIAKNKDTNANNEDLNTLLAAYDNGTEISVTVADGVTGNAVISGNAYIESIKITAQDEEIVKYDFSFVGNGAATIGVTS